MDHAGKCRGLPPDHPAVGAQPRRLRGRLLLFLPGAEPGSARLDLAGCHLSSAWVSSNRLSGRSVRAGPARDGPDDASSLWLCARAPGSDRHRSNLRYFGCGPPRPTIASSPRSRRSAWSPGMPSSSSPRSLPSQRPRPRLARLRQGMDPRGAGARGDGAPEANRTLQPRCLRGARHHRLEARHRVARTSCSGRWGPCPPKRSAFACWAPTRR